MITSPILAARMSVYMQEDLMKRGKKLRMLYIYYKLKGKTSYPMTKNIWILIIFCNSFEWGFDNIVVNHELPIHENTLL